MIHKYKATFERRDGEGGCVITDIKARSLEDAAIKAREQMDPAMGKDPKLVNVVREGK